MEFKQQDARWIIKKIKVLVHTTKNSKYSKKKKFILIE